MTCEETSGGLGCRFVSSACHTCQKVPAIELLEPRFTVRVPKAGLAMFMAVSWETVSHSFLSILPKMEHDSGKVNH